MKLYIKQKVFTLGESFNVVDRTGNTRYVVSGSFLQIPKQFTIYNSDNEMVCTIEKQLFRFMGHYNIHAMGKSPITLSRKFTFFFSAYEIEGINWRLEGDFLAHDYRLVYGDEIIMHLSKHWFTWGDSYELDIIDEDNEVLALAIAICVDHQIEADRSNN